MNWSSYLSYLGFSGLLVLVPGADFAVIVKNTLTGGGPRGRWCAAGVSSAAAVQGLAAVAGLGGVIVRCQPLFQAVRWAGIGYLVYLALQALRSAWTGRYAPVGPAPVDSTGERAAAGEGGERASVGGGGAAGSGDVRHRARARARAGWRQGFLSNITNPKVLVFYLAVLPQFMGATTPPAMLPLFGLSHALLALAYLLLLVAGLHRLRRLLDRRRVRRALDAATGVVLLAFGARLATEHT